MVLEQKSFCRQQVAQELTAHMAEVAGVDAVEVRRGAAGVLQIVQKGRGGSGGHSRTHVVDVFYFIVLHPPEGGGAELHTLTGGRSRQAPAAVAVHWAVGVRTAP